MFALVFGLLRATVRIAILTAIMVTGYALGFALAILVGRIISAVSLAIGNGAVRAYRATKARLASRTAPAPETRAHVAPGVPRSAIPATDVRWAH